MNNDSLPVEVVDIETDNTITLFNYAYHLVQTKYFDGIKQYSKNRNYTTKH